MPPSLRKRGHVNLDERSDGSDQSDAEENHHEEDAAEVAPTKAARSTPRRRAPKAQKTAGKSTARGSHNDAAPPDVSILEVVQHHSGAVPALAKSWVHEYKEDRTHALASLLTFFVQACGSSYEVSDEEVDEGEVDKLVQSVLRQAVENGIDDHFSARGKGGGKAFRGHFLEAWDHLVREAAAAEILFDGFVLSKLLDLVMAMANATVRPFRLVAATAVMQLVTSMIRVMSTLEDAQNTAQRQLEAEQKRKGNKAAAERATSLRRTRDQANHRLEELKGHIKLVFDTVAAHRFRDVSEEIRAVIIVGIGQWIALMPSVYLLDTHLKYLAWALSDKDAGVRQAAATALLALYNADDNVSPLHAFTARFSTRFAELVYDVDEGVAVKGIQLMTRLAKLEEVEGTAVRDTFRLLVDDAAPVRHAAAELVADLLPDFGERQLQPKQKGKRQAAAAKPSEKDLQLSGLLYIMYLLANDEEDDEETPQRRRMSADGHATAEKPLEPDMVNHVVDALFDRVELLTDWRALTGALDEDAAGADSLSTAAVANLLQLLAASVHKACGGTLVSGRQDARKGTSKAQKAAVEERRQTATLACMKALPSLMRKHQTDPVQAAALASIMTDLQLEVFSLRKAEPALQGLLGQVADMFKKHVAHPILDACTRALVHATSDGSDATKDHARLVLESVADAVAERLAEGVDAVDHSSDSQLACSLDGASQDLSDGGSNVGYTVAAALLRADRLQLQSGALSSSQPFSKSITRILQAAADGRDLGPDIIGGAARNAFMLLLWRFNGLDREDPEADELRELADARWRTTTLLETTLEASQQDAVREAVFKVLGDLYLVFGGPSLSGGPLAPLHAPPAEAPLRRLWGVCEDILDQQVQVPPSQSQDVDAVEAAEEALEAQKEHAVMVIGRLAVFGAAGAHQRLLSAQLLSHLAGHGARVEAALKEIVRQLKKVDAAALPEQYCQALQIVSMRDGSEEALLKLAERIAAAYPGFNPDSATACETICRTGAAFALSNPPANLDLFSGLRIFASKLPAERAAAFLPELEAAAAAAMPDESADEWQPYLVMLDRLRDRGVKGKTPRAALKKAGARGGRSTAQRSGRRISFAEQESQEEPASADDGEPEEEVREEDIPQRRRGRRPQDEVEDIIEEPAADLRAASESESQELPEASPRQTSLPAASPSRGDDEDDLDPEDVMPTEEQLPSSTKRGRARRSTKRKQPVMTKLYAASEDEKSAEAADSDDELLRADEVGQADEEVAASPPRQRRRLSATQDSNGATDEAVSPTQDYPPPRAGYGRRRR